MGAAKKKEVAAAQHTVGPWRAEFGNSRAHIVAKLEHTVAEVLVLRSTNAEEDRNRDVMVANARLIAAAPELLEALEGLLKQFPWPDSHEAAVARAAIAKARGES